MLKHKAWNYYSFYQQLHMQNVTTTRSFGIALHSSVYTCIYAIYVSWDRSVGVRCQNKYKRQHFMRKIHSRSEQLHILPTSDLFTQKRLMRNCRILFIFLIFDCLIYVLYCFNVQWITELLVDFCVCNSD